MQAATMQEFKYARIQICKNTNMQEYKYASIQICKHTNMQAYKNASIQICKHTHMQEYKQARIQICNMYENIYNLYYYAGIQQSGRKCCSVVALLKGTKDRREAERKRKKIEAESK